LVPAVAVALVLAFAIGALSQVGRGSGPYRRTVNRSFASLVTLEAVRSNATGLGLAEALVFGPTMARGQFFSALDRVASDAADEARQLDAAVPPMPSVRAGEGCLAAMAARASATASIRRSLEGVLGGSSGASIVAPGQALAALESASLAVVGADEDWATCRRALRRAPGTATVPVSRWLEGQGWYSAAALASSVNSVLLSRTLAARHALAVTATRIDPPPLPGSGPALLAPTSTLTLHVVVSDTGNVDEPAVQVRAVLVGGQAPAPLSAVVPVVAGRSVAVVLGPFPVVPGSSYTLQVFVTPSSGPGGASSATALQVAAEPTTTTTATTTTTTVPKAKEKPTSAP
jgi:hypothetical protein